MRASFLTARNMMRLAFLPLVLTLPTTLYAATPIDGWYSSLFVGYAYMPSNVNKVYENMRYTDAAHQAGYLAGGNLGYKSNPLRYEGEVSYFNANVSHFSQNYIRQNNVGGYNNGISGMANVYYDFPGVLSAIAPYLGFGIGYAWLHEQLNNLAPSTRTNFTINSSAFAYQALAGLTYNFAENYDLSIGYRYLGTPNLFSFGSRFQSHFAVLGVAYRFDNARYK
jgi:opacity protein-like surface antigen